MKETLLFVVCLLLSIQGFSQSHPYQPMAIDSAYWFIEDFYIDPSGPPIPQYSQDVYGINGDTLVNNFTYKKVYNFVVL